MQDEYRRRGSIEGSNVPGNPLRSYRMSMLAHGFVDADGSGDFSLDDSDAMSYSVVRIRRNQRWGFAISAVVLFLALVAGILVAA